MRGSKPLFVLFLIVLSIRGFAQESISEISDFFQETRRFEDGNLVKVLNYSKRNILKLPEYNINSVADEPLSYQNFSGVELDIIQGKELLIHQLISYINQNPSSNHNQKARVELVYLFCELKNYSESRRVLNEISEEMLSSEEKRMFFFLEGVVLAQEGKSNEAVQSFGKVAERDDDIFWSSQYHQAQILFEAERYKEALPIFRKIERKPEYRDLAPFFIFESLNKTTTADSLLMQTEAYLSRKKLYNYDYIFYETSNKHFQKKDYTSFIQTHKKFGDTTFTDRNYRFMLAISYFNEQQNELSFENFRAVIDTLKDDLSQKSYYYIAHIFLREKKYNFSQIGFDNCKKLKKINALTEVCDFESVKLIYQMNNNPFVGPVKTVQNFIESYPNSSYISSAYEMLANSYLRSKKYDEAIDYIEKVQGFKQKNKLAETYQEITFQRGVEYYILQKYNEAKKFFEKSLSVKRQNKHELSIFYLTNEILYRNGAYDAVVERVKEQKNFSRKYYGSSEYLKVLYTQAYSLWNLKKYREAYESFYKITTMYSGEVDSDLKSITTDSYIRLGDISFIFREFKEAIVFYNKSLKRDDSPPEYVYYNLAKSYGLNGQSEKKLKVLNNLMRTYPESPSLAEFKNEKAETYIGMKDNEAAFGVYEDIIASHEGTKFFPIAFLQTGNIRYNQGKNTEAVKQYESLLQREVDKSYKDLAVQQIQQIYTEQGNSDGFETLIQQYPEFAFSERKIDTVLFQIAKFQYLENNWMNASREFGKYLKRYTEGSNRLSALYYKAESDFKLEREADAYAGFLAVVEQKVSPFYAPSLVKVVEILVKKNDTLTLRKYSEQLWKNSERQANRINGYYYYEKTSFETQMYDEFIQNYDEKMTGSLSQKRRFELELFYAKSLTAVDQAPKALEVLEKLSKKTKSKFGAEAKYLMAEILYKTQKHDRVAKTIFELNDNFYPHTDWVAKGFLLLGDNYRKQNNIFQARHTYQSLIDNYDGEDLVNLAKRKLDSIKKEEK